MKVFAFIPLFLVFFSNSSLSRELEKRDKYAGEGQYCDYERTCHTYANDGEELTCRMADKTDQCQVQYQTVNLRINNILREMSSDFKGFVGTCWKAKDINVIPPGCCLGNRDPKRATLHTICPY